MIAAPTLPEALWRWAAATPEEPWLFQPRGADWKWLSFAEVAAGTARVAAALAGAAPPATEGVEFGSAPRPEVVALDFAIQGLGWTSRPAAEGAPRLLPSRLAVSLPALEPRRRARAVPLPSVPSGAGDVVVRDGGGERRLGQGELARLAAQIDAALPAAPKRDIAVFHRPLFEPGARALLAWATASGAALLLQPEPGYLAASVVWARPTIVAANVLELAQLHAALARHAPRRDRRRHKRGPLGRLRAVLALDAPSSWVDAEEASFWRDLGAAVVSAPGRAASPAR